MKTMLKPILVLTLICVVASALLGLTYNVTAPLIAQAAKAASDAAMAEVLPAAQSFEELPAPEGVEGILVFAKGDGGAGYVFKTQSKGFGGAFQVMVGIDNEGKVTGSKLLDNNETPGLGSKTADPKFTNQFVGKGPSLDDIETITGATVSSKAFIDAVEIALRGYEAVKEGA